MSNKNSNILAIGSSTDLAEETLGALNELIGISKCILEENKLTNEYLSEISDLELTEEDICR